MVPTIVMINRAVKVVMPAAHPLVWDPPFVAVAIPAVIAVGEYHLAIAVRVIIVRVEGRASIPKDPSRDGENEQEVREPRPHIRPSFVNGRRLRRRQIVALC